jgi:TonB-linked SusC/RagA family outer membrane protein
MKLTLTKEELFKRSRKIILLSLVFTGLFLMLGNNRVLADDPESENMLQQRTVTGTIRDEAKAPMPGVNIWIEGTSIGVISDINGKYSISVPSADAVIVFSFVGYNEMKVSSSGRTTIDVTMEPSVESLDEVVVVGYGVQRKRDVTGSITSVKTEDLQNLTMTSAAQALQGKAAGVQIINQSGAPGASASIQIRGYSSNSRTEPLIIVDGLKVPNMNYLDPENIESIEVLKDGASAAIYGIEAGNGVILVTTKSGGGQGKVFYNFQYTTQSIANYPKTMNAQQYMQYQIESGSTQQADFLYDGFTDTDWGKLMFEKGTMPRHVLGFQGGNDRGNLYVSLTSINNDGIVTGQKDTYNRLTGQINADYKFKEWIKVGATTSVERTKSNAVSEGGTISVLGAVMAYDPITPWSYAPGTEPARINTWINQGYELPTDPKTGYIYGSSPFAGNSLIWHPAVMRDKTDSDNHSFNIRGTAFADFSPIKGLVITSRFGYRAGYSMNNTYNHPVFVNATANQKMSINGRSSNNLYYQWENFANYLFNLGSHNFTLMAGNSYQRSEGDFVYGSADQLSNLYENYRYLSNAINSTGMSVSGGLSESANMSYYGRAGWTYMNKYNLMASFRADAYDTSKLDKSNRWGYFPSISGGWTISSEPFMDNVKQKFALSFLKLRASYGINGNVGALGSYQYNTTLSTGINYGYDFTDGQLTGAYPSNRLPNPAIKWETSRQFNIGFDARFLRDRLDLSLDWFNKNTFDLLTSTEAPSNTGASSVYVNAGKVNNKGVELMLGWRDEIAGFRYSINGNLATLKNLVTEGTSPDRVPGAGVHSGYTVTYFEEGYPLWYLRTFVVEDFDENGYAVYKDFDGVPGINAQDQTMTGNPIPDLTYGLTVNLAYKNFDLNVYGAGVYGNERLYACLRGDFPQQNNLAIFFTDRWTPENPNARFPRPDFTDTYQTTTNLRIFDASFFKIKQIQLGYNLPKSILQKAWLSELRAYVSLDDWFTFTSYPGLDPETSVNTTQSLAIDAGGYPISRKVVFGINVAF